MKSAVPADDKPGIDKQRKTTMKLLRASLMMIGSLAIAFAQDGLTAVASKTVTLTPTESIIQFTVQTDTQKTLDDVLSKVKDVGLAVENLASITSIPGVASPVPGVTGLAGTNTYTFRLNVPLSQTTPTLQ